MKKGMTMDLTHVFVPLVKMQKNDDGTLLVSGPATSAALDRDMQICDPDWLDRAMPQWFGEGGNIREMHTAIAAGTAIAYEKKSDGKHWVDALVVDPSSVAKCEHGVLKGYSIGIKGARVVKSEMAPNGAIIDGNIIEVSLVDRPANPECMLTIAKSDELGVIAPVEQQVLVEGDAVAELVAPEAAPEVVEAPAEPAAELEEPVEVPAELPARPVAPAPATPSTAPLMAASADVRAQARSVMDALSSLGLIKADSQGTTGKADDESKDIRDAKAAIAAIARLIQSEAQGLADGELDEVYDIDCLLMAVDGLRWFIDQEAAEDTGKSELPEVPAPVVDKPAEPVTISAKADAPLTPVPAEQPVTVSLEKVQELIDAALTKAVASHEAETQSLRDELAKVKAEPMPGGPVRVPTQSQKSMAMDHDTRLILKSARDYDERAEATTDRDLREGYRQLAAAERAKVTR